MKEFATFEEIGVPGTQLVLAMDKLPKNIFFDKNGKRVIQLCFTHGIVSAEEMAFHMRNILTDDNFTRIQRNENVEQMLTSNGKRYRVNASLWPLSLFIFPISPL